MDSETGGVTVLATVSPEVESETGSFSGVTELATDVDSRGVNPLNHLAILQSDVTDLDSLHAIAYLSPINVSNIIGHTVTYCLSEVDSALTPNFEMTEANGSLMETPRTTIDISDIAESTFACNSSTSKSIVVVPKTNDTRTHGESSLKKKQVNSYAKKHKRLASCSKFTTRSASKLSKDCQSQQSSAHKSHLPTAQKKNSKRKKCAINNTPVLSVLDIPSASEDSLLSGSDDEECSMLNRETKHCTNTQRFVPQEVKGTQNKCRKYSWKGGSLVTDNESIRFTGVTELPEELSSLQTPLQFFLYFFTNDIINYIVEQTNTYSASQRPEKPLNISKKEVETFIGVCLYMSLIKMSSCKNYWSNRFRVEKIAGVMTSKAFLTMKRYLHFCDNGVANDDRLLKIRALIEMIKQQFKKVPLEENLSIDELMVPFKGRSSLKQYLPKKLHKWGYKSLCYLATVDLPAILKFIQVSRIMYCLKENMIVVPVAML